MAATAKTVKDVQSHEFVKAYAAHLKRTGKVSPTVSAVLGSIFRTCAASFGSR
jgi:ribosomal protein S19E (S16A)